MVVYQIQNKINGKIYIGQTRKDLPDRWRHHVWEALRGKKEWALSRAIRKYGAVAFDMKVLHTAKTQRELNAMETFFIILHQSHLSENGYNLSMGGDGLSYWTGKKRSRESVDKGMDTRRRNGTVCPSGWNQDPEVNAARVATRTARGSYGMHRKGKKHSPETIALMRAKAMGNTNRLGK